MRLVVQVVPFILVQEQIPKEMVVLCKSDLGLVSAEAVVRLPYPSEAVILALGALYL